MPARTWLLGRGAGERSRLDGRELGRTPRLALGAPSWRVLGASGANDVAKLVRVAGLPKGEHASLAHLGGRHLLGRRLQEDRLATSSLLHAAPVHARDVFEPDAATVGGDVEHGVLARDVPLSQREQGHAARRVATDCERGAGRQRDRRRPACASPVDARIQR